MTPQAAHAHALSLVGEIERLLETLKERLAEIDPAQKEYKPSSHPTLGSL
jgi:hypothetical protein